MPNFSWNGVFLSIPVIDWNCSLMNNKSRGWFCDPWFLFIFITYFPNQAICGNYARCFVTTERPRCAGQWLLADKAVQHLKTSQTCLKQGTAWGEFWGLHLTQVPAGLGEMLLCVWHRPHHRTQPSPWWRGAAPVSPLLPSSTPGGLLSQAFLTVTRTSRKGPKICKIRSSLYLDQIYTESSRILSSFRELIFWIQVFLQWGDVVKKLFIMEFILGSNCLPA